MRKFLDAVRASGELRTVSGASATDEIGPITEINAKSARPKALLFDDIEGYPKGFRVLTGAIDSPRRLGLALGFEATTTADIIARLNRGAVRKWIEGAPRFAPRQVALEASGLRRVACDKDGINVESFPAPLWHQQDGGRYIGTGCVVLTRAADGSWVNAGSYRVMVQGFDTVTILFATTSRHGRAQIMSWWDKGEAAPVAIVVGGPPLLALLAGVEIPVGVSELNIMGAALGAPIDVVTSNLTGLPVPAESELVLEGFLDPGALAEEGPFGEFTGYYASGSHQAPVARIETIWMRDDPIILGASPGKPPQDFEYGFSVIRSALLQDAIEAAGVEGITAVWTSFCRQWIVVAVKQNHPGHARQAAWIAANCGPGAYFSRYIVAVDDDIDPANMDEVLWAIMTRSDPATDIDVARMAWGSPIDPMGGIIPDGKSYNTRAIVDASIPFTKKHLFPKVVATEPARLRELAAKWKDVFEN